MGKSLAAYGNVLCGMNTFYRLTNRSLNKINLGILTLRKGADLEKTARHLSSVLPKDVEVITQKTLLLREEKFWRNTTPIGFFATAGMIIAMFVGAVIIYQILYTDINDHIKEYATLKALGMNNQFFLKLVLHESILLVVIGFFPALIFCHFLFKLTVMLVGVPTRLELGSTLFVFILSTLMCMGAGFFATRRLYSADPSDVF